MAHDLPYPASWEADVLAADGGIVHLRPIRPDDRDRILGLHSRMSERTRYLRYFGPYPRMPERDLQHFTNVDYADRVALVAMLGPDIVAVGRYDRIDSTDEAEVAFVVEDAHQGRGIGSVLLEHLAAAARERGIHRFVADVLAENARMVRVFKDAGYVASHSYDGGVVHLSFSIEPTETSVAVAYERERRAEARSIERLLVPRSVAVIGASADLGTAGHEVFANLIAYGFAGLVLPVNPAARQVGGVPAYPSVLDVPEDVDLAVVAIPPPDVLHVVAECAAKNVRGLVVLSAGFGERGPAGPGGAEAADGREAAREANKAAELEAELQAERALVAAARGSGMRVVGPNCLGVINADPEVRLNATLARVAPGPGRVGFFCHSAALGVAILQAATDRGLGLSTFVSAGNRADVSGNDLLQYWAGDPATEVVLLYLESFGNPRKFARLARRVARTKPIVAVKTGRYGSSSALAASSVPLPEESVQAIFERSGVIRVDTLVQLFDVAELLAYQPLPAGRTVAAVTNSSALAVLVADAGLGCGLRVSAGSVDIGPDATPAELASALRATVAADRVGAIVVVLVAPLGASGEEYGQTVAEFAADSPVPLVATFLGTASPPAALRRVGADGSVGRGSVPLYPTPERAVRALAAVVRYSEWRQRPAGAVPELPGIPSDGAPDAARRLVAQVLAGAPSGRQLTADEAAALLAEYGLRLEPSRPARSADEAVAAAGQLGYPVAMKSTAPALRHRRDLGGVRLDLADAAAVRAAWSAIAGLRHAAAPGRDTGAETGPDTGPGTSPKTGPAISPDASPKTGPAISPKTGPAISPKTGPAISPKTGPAISPDASPKTGPGISPDAGPATGPATGPKIGARTAGAADTEPSVIIQHMAAPGVTTVVEVIDDPSFGALVSFGIGGVATDLLGDRVYAAVPLSDTDAAELVAAPRAAPLLSGYEGADPVDVRALTDLLLRVSRLAEDLPEVLHLAVNPLVGRSGLAVLAARIHVGPPTARVDPGPRRLR